MNDGPPAVILIIFFLLAVILLFFQGRAYSQLKKEAVQHGYAEWKVNDEGVSNWQWKVSATQATQPEKSCP